MTLEKMESLFSPHDLKRLELYSRNMADHHLITDLLPACKFTSVPFSHHLLPSGSAAVQRQDSPPVTCSECKCENSGANDSLVTWFTGNSAGTWAAAQDSR